jgi:Na+/proline symporter
LSPYLLLFLILGYFGILVLTSWFTSRGGDNQSFFVADRQAPWYLVAFGMIGASLSGVTFVSVPGAVGANGGNNAFSYFQLVLGYFVGYQIIIRVLLPLYYRLNLTSIYEYLRLRLGSSSHYTGASFFLLSRTIGSSFRLYLVSMILDRFILGPLGIPFALTVVLTIALIWLYTYRGGMKTIVITDTFQTAFLLLAVMFSVYSMMGDLGWSALDLYQSMTSDALRCPDNGAQAGTPMDQIFFGDSGSRNFWKMFLSGIFITVVMTGLDQDMMQKNLSCRNLRDAQKNMFWFSLVLVAVNLLFLVLGYLLYAYVDHRQIPLPAKADLLFPTLAFEHFSVAAGLTFVIGLIAAAYSTADSALAALTTSFCVDFLGFDQTKGSTRTRKIVHLGMSLLLAVQILIFHSLHNESLITQLFTVAGYTYGPLLGMFAFGLATQRPVRDRWVPWVAVAAPVLCYFLKANADRWLGGYQFGFELLILNGALTFGGLWLLSKPASPVSPTPLTSS